VNNPAGLEALKKLKMTPQCLHHRGVMTPGVCITGESQLPSLMEPEKAV